MTAFLGHQDKQTKSNINDVKCSFEKLKVTLDIMSKLLHLARKIKLI